MAEHKDDDVVGIIIDGVGMTNNLDIVLAFAHLLGADGMEPVSRKMARAALEHPDIDDEGRRVAHMMIKGRAMLCHDKDGKLYRPDEEETKEKTNADT